MPQQTTSKLLINEPPLQVLPTLACILGLNEAIALQQLHYWLILANKSKNFGKYHKGRWWIHNDTKTWQRDNFPFWSEKTVRRAFDTLRERGVVLVDRLSDNNLDQTLYYTIDYDAINHLFDAQEFNAPQSGQGDEPVRNNKPNHLTGPENPALPFGQLDQLGNSPDGQNDQMEVPDGQNDHMQMVNLSTPDGQLDHLLNKESETTSETTQRVPAHPSTPIEEIWKACLNQLRLQMAQTVFRRWVQHLRPVDPSNGAPVYILAAPDQLTRDWCTEHLSSTLARMIAPLYGQPVQVTFTVLESA